MKSFALLDLSILFCKMMLLNFSLSLTFNSCIKGPLNEYGGGLSSIAQVVTNSNAILGDAAPWGDYIMEVHDSIQNLNFLIHLSLNIHPASNNIAQRAIFLKIYIQWCPWHFSNYWCQLRLEQNKAVKNTSGLHAIATETKEHACQWGFLFRKDDFYVPLLSSTFKMGLRK